MPYRRRRNGIDKMIKYIEQLTHSELIQLFAKRGYNIIFGQNTQEIDEEELRHAYLTLIINQSNIIEYWEDYKIRQITARRQEIIL
jgi:hypothetical protein